MKVLVYVDPSLLFEAFMPSLTVVRNHLFNFCAKALLESGEVEVKAVVSEIARHQADENGGIGGIELIALPYAEFGNVFPVCRSLASVHLEFYRHGAEEYHSRRLADWLLPQLKGWTPDVVLAFQTQAAPFSRIFPRALCLTMENGIFSRDPFPRALRFEPMDSMNGFLNCFRERIWNFPVDDAARESVRSFRLELLNLLIQSCPFREQLEAARSKFRHLVLCPVPAFDTYGDAAKEDQFLWLTDILKRIPSDIGMIVTFHDNVQAQLNELTLSFLKAKHPNLLEFHLRGIFPSSTYFFPFVDAILNYETMTGTLGMLVCPRVVSLDKSYSNWMADSSGLDGLSDVLSRPAPDRTALIYWYLTHFTVCEKRFSDSKWYFNFLDRKLKYYRENGVRFELFGKVEEIDDICNYVLCFVKNKYAQIGEQVKCKHREKHCVYSKIANCFEKWALDFREKARISCHRL